MAFDPRVPHGVNRVIGTNDPRQARVVIHGWFNAPEVCWFGPWGGDDNDNDNDNDDDNESTSSENRYDRATAAAAITLDESLQPLVETLGSGEIGRIVGYLAARVEINEDGCVDHVYSVCDTIQADPEDFRGVIGYDDSDRPIMEDAVGDIRLNVFEALKTLQFEGGGGVVKKGRALVVPFAFE